MTDLPNSPEPAEASNPATASERPERDRAIRPLRLLVAALIGLASHGVTALAAYVAAQVTHPSPGDEFGDLAALATTALVVEIIIGAVCVIGGTVIFARGRRDIGLGLAAGWLVGLFAGCFALGLT